MDEEKPIKKRRFTEALFTTDSRDPQEEALSLLAEALAHIEHAPRSIAV